MLFIQKSRHYIHTLEGIHTTAKILHDYGIERPFSFKSASSVIYVLKDSSAEILFKSFSIHNLIINSII